MLACHGRTHRTAITTGTKPAPASSFLKGALPLASSLALTTITCSRSFTTSATCPCPRYAIVSAQGMSVDQVALLEGALSVTNILTCRFSIGARTDSITCTKWCLVYGELICLQCRASRVTPVVFKRQICSVVLRSRTYVG
jgi:hypothetical protein